MKTLDEIVSRAYALFADYKATAPLDVCTDCCLSKKHEQELVSLVVNSIPFDLLYEYNTAAKPEKPNIDEFRHFLPRFLELTADFQFVHHSIEIVLYRFDYYDKSEWSQQEQQLMQDFGEAFFRKCLSVYPWPELGHIDEVLIMLYRTKIDMQPLLDEWLKHSNAERLLHFKELHESGFNREGPAKLASPFADQLIKDTLYNWLQAEETKTVFSGYIEEFIMNPSAAIDDTELTRLSWIYDVLTFKTST